MTIISITDEQIDDLIIMPKLIANPGARWRELSRTRLKDYTVTSSDTVHKFSIFVRQSTRLLSSFSVGLIWHSGEEKLVLMRCNGSSHVHRNKLEKETIQMLPHIHIATARYISIGKKDEGYAEETSAYNDIEGALALLLRRCNVASDKHQDIAQSGLFDA